MNIALSTLNFLPNNYINTTSVKTEDLSHIPLRNNRNVLEYSPVLEVLKGSESSSSQNWRIRVTTRKLCPTIYWQISVSISTNILLKKCLIVNPFTSTQVHLRAFNGSALLEEIVLKNLHFHIILPSK